MGMLGAPPWATTTRDWDEGLEFPGKSLMEQPPEPPGHNSSCSQGFRDNTMTLELRDRPRGGAGAAVSRLEIQEKVGKLGKPRGSYARTRFSTMWVRELNTPCRTWASREG